MTKNVGWIVFAAFGLTGCSHMGRHTVSYYQPAESSPVEVASAAPHALRNAKLREMRQEIFWRGIEIGIDIGVKAGTMLLLQSMDTDGRLAAHEQAESLAVSAGLEFAGKQLKDGLTKLRE